MGADVGNLGGSKSDTKNETFTQNQEVTASDNAVAQSFRGSSQAGGIRVRIGKRGSYVGDTTNTFTTVTGAAPGESPGIISALAGLLPRPDSQSDSVDRANAQIAAGGAAAVEEIKSGGISKGMWALIIIGGAVVVFFAWKKLRKKG